MANMSDSFLHVFSISIFCLALTLTVCVNSFELVEVGPCGNIPRLGVVPGLGWDSLQSEEMSRVLQVSYLQCKTTEDGRYLIPDDTEAISMKRNDFKTVAELIDDFSYYVPITGNGFGVSANVPVVSFQGSFSHDYMSIKRKLATKKTALIRISLRNTLYRLQMKPAAKLTEDIRDQLMEIFKSLGKNNTEKAEYLAQMMVREYGTHFARRIDAGAIFLSEDLIDANFVQQYEKDKNEIKAAAEADFFGFFSFNFSSQYYKETAMLEQYKSNRLSRQIKTLGGTSYTSGMNVDKWVAGIPDNIIVIDRSGDSLPGLVTPARFPKAPVRLLKQTYEILDKAVNDYNSYNIHEGCTNPNSGNYDYNANVNDGSCKSTTSTHSFGGVYQECSQYLYQDKVDLCSKYEIRNPQTGGFSCPSGYKDVYLYSQSRETVHHENKPYEVCRGWWIFKKCHMQDNWLRHNVYATIKSYSCIASLEDNPSAEFSGYYFGGLYSSDVLNIVTNSLRCPPDYRTITLFDTGRVMICVSNKVPRAKRVSLPFAGLTSCKNNLRCPLGYVGHLATVFEGCQINYCVSPSHKLVSDPIRLNRPPFKNISAFFDDNNYFEDVQFDDYGVPERLTSEENSSLHSGVIAIICFIILLVLIGIIYWQRKQIRLHGNRLREVIYEFSQMRLRALQRTNSPVRTEIRLGNRKESAVPLFKGPENYGDVITELRMKSERRNV